jgi:hypothetical protein
MTEEKEIILRGEVLVWRWVIVLLLMIFISATVMDFMIGNRDSREIKLNQDRIRAMLDKQFNQTRDVDAHLLACVQCHSHHPKVGQ